MKDIGDKLRRCPVGVCSTFKTDLAVNSVLGGNFVAIWVSNLYIYIYIYSDQNVINIFYCIQPGASTENMMFKAFQNNKCRLTIAQETMAFRPYYMLAHKNSSYNMELNKA